MTEPAPPALPAPRTGWIRVAVSGVAVGAVVLSAGTLRPTSPGGLAVTSAHALLGILWTLGAVAALWPGRAPIWSRLGVLVVLLPVTTALATAVGVGLSAPLLWFVAVASHVAAARTPPSESPRRTTLVGAALACLWLGPPAVAYTVAELGLGGAAGWLTISPWTIGAALAGSAAEPNPLLPLPGVLCALALGTVRLRSRLPHGRGTPT